MHAHTQRWPKPQFVPFSGARSLKMQFKISKILSLCTWARQLPRIAPANAGFLCGTTAVFSDKIKETPCISDHNFSANLRCSRIYFSTIICRELLRQCCWCETYVDRCCNSVQCSAQWHCLPEKKKRKIYHYFPLKLRLRMGEDIPLL
jgi:hypothetical protein